MYGKLIDNQIEYALNTYVTDMGQIIVNFDKNVDLMVKYGYKEVIDIRPSYDEATQFLEIENYTEDINSITINYIIKDKVIVPSLEDRMNALEEEQLNLKESLLNQYAILNEEVNK